MNPKKNNSSINKQRAKNPPTQKHQIDVSHDKLGMDASPKH